MYTESLIYIYIPIDFFNILYNFFFLIGAGFDLGSKASVNASFLRPGVSYLTNGY